MDLARQWARLYVGKTTVTWGRLVVDATTLLSEDMERLKDQSLDASVELAKD